MDLIISTAEESWKRDGDVEEIVILDMGGETSITQQTASQLRMLRSCLLFCAMSTGEAMWCALSCGVMSVNPEGRVLITTRDVIVFDSADDPGHSLGFP